MSNSIKFSLDYSFLIPIFPLFCFALIIFGGKIFKNFSSLIAICGVGCSFLFSIIIFVGIFFGHSLAEHPYNAQVILAEMGDFKLRIGITIDNLTAMMLFVVTLVSLLVHIYSTSYMHGDKLYPRYFAYLEIFTMAMLILVLSDNFLLIYVGWELVGLASYLLIGFWFEKPEAAAASMKAFLTTRVGDAGMFLGIATLFGLTISYYGFSGATFNFNEVFNFIYGNKELVNSTIINTAAVLLFLGAVGKSAQFPLHVWLPDAMEGPTPVSALIHAATMVAAGVYLVARLFPIFDAAPAAMLVVAYVGGFTAIFAATIGLVMYDIKKVLAYSTISQLGYMMLALGVGGYTAGVFHLMTHAYFKALMFLGSGSVIHACHSQDMRDMGGLSKKMPITYWTFLIGSLSIAGIFPLAGFWSKDEILADAFKWASPYLHTITLQTVVHILPWFMGALAALMTAFYMFRLIFMTFSGNYRGHGHPHESPAAMTVPLLILAVLAVSAGWIGTPWANKFHELIHYQRPSANTVVSGQWSVVSRHKGTEPSAFSLQPSAATNNQQPTTNNHLQNTEHRTQNTDLVGTRHSAVENRKSKIENRKSTIGNQHSAIDTEAQEETELHVPEPNWFIMTLSTIIALTGIFFAYLIYKAKIIDEVKIRTSFAWLHNLLSHKYYMDEFYIVIFVKGGLAFIKTLRWIDTNIVDGIVNLVGYLGIVWSRVEGWFDKWIIDGIVNATGIIVKFIGKILRMVQTGYVQNYIFIIFLTVLLVLLLKY